MYLNYKYPKLIVYIISLILFILLFLLLSFNYTIWSSNYNKSTMLSSASISTNKVISEQSNVKEESPKNIESVYNVLVKNNITPERLKINLQGDIIVVDRIVNDAKVTFYLEYSKVYDCTIAKTDIRIKDPIQIFYHYEYDLNKDLSNSIFDFLNSYMIESKDKVRLDRKEDGTINLSIE